ncbi:hydrolase, NUDIX family [Clostridiales bacterium oral taxon 876 str. F0540]|nr:hydrolase, NUDIX family [Clostridiales bacterium oral taxon 876 str. F0540]
MNKEILINLVKKFSPEDIQEKESKEKILNFLHENDNFTGRDNNIGHITGSAWIVSKDRKKVLLTHHLKLDRWLQVGGHVESDNSMIESALREAREETGLTSIKVLSEEVFDIDVHLIPKRGDVEAHNHYDIRFLFEADENEKIKRQENESKAVKWVALAEVPTYAEGGTVLRMTDKTKLMNI